MMCDLFSGLKCRSEDAHEQDFWTTLIAFLQGKKETPVYVFERTFTCFGVPPFSGKFVPIYGLSAGRPPLFQKTVCGENCLWSRVQYTSVLGYILVLDSPRNVHTSPLLLKGITVPI